MSAKNNLEKNMNQLEDGYKQQNPTDFGYIRTAIILSLLILFYKTNKKKAYKMNAAKKLYKNWTVHNLIAHPLSEIIWLISFGRLEKLGNWLHDVTLPEHTHDVTLPEHTHGEGRG